MVFLYIILLLIASAVLVKGADIIIKTLVYFARYWRISEFLVSFILAGFITSLPELSVGIISAFHKAGILSLGNVIGSNIADIGLVAGLIVVLAKGIKTENIFLRKNILYVIFFSLCPVLILLDGTLSRGDAGLLLLIFALYGLILYHQSERYEKVYERALRREFFKEIFFFLIGVILLLGSSEAIVRLARLVAQELAIPILFLGLFLVAIGTSLPELVFAFRAVTQGRKEMVLGGILGSLLVNSTLILGATGLIHPIEIINTNLFLSSVGFMIISLFLFGIFVYSRKKLSWQEGIALVWVYILFVAIEFWVKKG